MKIGDTVDSEVDFVSIDERGFEIRWGNNIKRVDTSIVGKRCPICQNENIDHVAVREFGESINVHHFSGKVCIVKGRARAQDEEKT